MPEQRIKLFHRAEARPRLRQPKFGLALKGSGLIAQVYPELEQFRVPGIKLILSEPPLFF
jgi:hypothetical protein